MIAYFFETYPWQIALAIVAAFLIVLALVYPASYIVFRVKFKYANGQTLMQLRKTPNILARIFFYSKPTTVLYIGNNKRWFTFHRMKAMQQVTNPGMVRFLHSEEMKSYIDYKRRTVKKERA